ncbi:FtsZ-interacting cell division protein YlmF [Ruminococcaceae bacterium YRB3002]|nr:FtsZ-interacting cell division protein YlmF [Ruminococcaceae bacterium YRB3002]
MGRFDVKNFFKSMVSADESYDDEYSDEYIGESDEFIDDGYYGEPEQDYSNVGEVPPYSVEPQPAATEFRGPVAVQTPVVPSHNAVVIMLTPYDIRTSQVVCDHIKQGHIVICNLTSSANNQRVVDYISGSVYALDGKIEPTPVKTTFVCTPKNVDLIVNSEEMAKPNVTAL